MKSMIRSFAVIMVVVILVPAVTGTAADNMINDNYNTTYNSFVYDAEYALSMPDVGQPLPSSSIFLQYI